MSRYIKSINNKDFIKLKVWEKSFALTSEIYNITAKFPALETYAIKFQILE